MKSNQVFYSTITQDVKRVVQSLNIVPIMQQKNTQAGKHAGRLKHIRQAGRQAGRHKNIAIRWSR
jgi:hypothetical protein